MKVYKESLPVDTLDFKDMKFRANSAKEVKDRILHIDLQYDAPMMWFDADEDVSIKEKDFEIFCLGTGHSTNFQLDKENNYLGTLMVGTYVFHYFIVDGTPYRDMLKNVAEKLVVEDRESLLKKKRKKAGR